MRPLQVSSPANKRATDGRTDGLTKVL